MAGDNREYLGVGLTPSPVMIMDAIKRKGIDLSSVQALIANAEPGRDMQGIDKGYDWTTYMLFHLRDNVATLQWVNRKTAGLYRTFNWELREGSFFEVWKSLPGYTQAVMCNAPVFRLNGSPDDYVDGLVAPAAIIDTIPPAQLTKAVKHPDYATTHQPQLLLRFERAWKIYLDAFHDGERIWVEAVGKNETVHRHYFPLPNNVSSFYQT